MKASFLISFICSAILLTGCLSSTGTDESCEDFDHQAQIEYLEQNANNEGVVVRDSGLQYRIIEEGEGSKPSSTDTVEIEYEVRFIDNTLYETTTNHPEPVQPKIEDILIPGLREGLLLMNEGATYRFFIPSELGFGTTASGPICPGATLIFDVTLVDIL